MILIQKIKAARTDDDGCESNIFFVCAKTTIDQGIAYLLMLILTPTKTSH